MVELLLFGTFFVLLLLSVPVAMALGLAAFVAIIATYGTFGLGSVSYVLYSSLQSEVLLAIPFFILAGTIMEYAGISARLIAFADSLVGHRRNGTVAVVILAAFIFAAISGSGPATVAALGTILIPALVRRGYHKQHAAALMASAGSMGIIVPPSITLIIFAVLASDYERVSVERLFMAGVVPGVLMAIALYIAARFMPRTEPAAVGAAAGPTGTPDPAGPPSGTRTPVSSTAHAVAAGTADGPVGPESGQRPGPASLATAETPPASAEDAQVFAELTDESAVPSRMRAFLAAIPGLLVPVIILGGIYGGIVTPTESAVLAAMWALVVGVLVYRELRLRDLMTMLVSASLQTATVMIIIAAASIFSYVITREGVAAAVAEVIFSITQQPVLVMALVIVLLLIVGAFVDATSALYMFVPLLVPVLLESGFSVTTIGVMMTVNLAVGLVTPPVGVNLFVAAGIARADLLSVARGVVPFLIAGVLVTIATAYIPALSNALPDLLGIE